MNQVHFPVLAKFKDIWLQFWFGTALLRGADTPESSASSGAPEWNKRERTFPFVKRTPGSPYTTLLHSQSPLKLFLWNVKVCSTIKKKKKR